MAALEVAGRALPLAQPPEKTPTPTHCVVLTLPSGGVLGINPYSTITLTADATFTPQCTAATHSLVGAEADCSHAIRIADGRDPFHASITPQAYATGAATIIAWMLVIMLIITPRTFFLGGPSGRSGLMGRRGMISGATGGGSVIGVGTRPWLQKVAALTVAVSLTVATWDTFKIAGRQYVDGYINADELRLQVVTSTEIKVSRMISDVFLWLAQVQTLIRLFPRHKEKVLIKWIGFGLILLDIAFSCLNNFGPFEDTRRPLHFTTAIPALNYLFQLSLSILYAAWVMYYAIMKRRFAFFHEMMWNISVVALLSLIAIITPIVFFILDLSDDSIAGWGDYFRWVGAAAASVIVWEWVERIEALEREERKDGILGREIYDGDEMLETTPSQDFWPRKRPLNYTIDDEKKGGDGGYDNEGGGFTTGTGFRFNSLGQQLKGLRRPQQNTTVPNSGQTIRIPAPAPARQRSDLGQRARRKYTDMGQKSNHSVPPVASPVSRADTTSADSTVYTIRYHPVSESPATGHLPGSSGDQSASTYVGSEPRSSNNQSTNDGEKGPEATSDDGPPSKNRWNWQVGNLFRRSGRSPPPEVQRGRVIEPLSIDDISTSIPPRNYAGLALKDRLGTFAAQQGEKFRSKKHNSAEDDFNLPVTIIPAHPRGRTWSPDQLAALGQEASTKPSLPSSTDSSESGPAGSAGNGGSSATQVNDAQGTSETPPASRNSHVRFAPQTFQRPAVRYQADLGRVSSLQPPSSSPLQRDVSPVDLGERMPPIDGHSTRTNHDR